MAEFTVRAIGVVRCGREDVRDDFWGDTVAEIELSPELPEDALQGLESFSHAEILFLFDRVSPESVVNGARRPRNNPKWPEVGIVAQRAKGRPNRLGSTIVRVLGVDGRRLRVAELDAAEGTPVLDIKPVMTEFLPREAVRQPGWTSELMAEYWSIEGN
jgi:tRNA-Thr(GGU) m(6)t(6)A37 methyltransferase TsaA